jgi:hypothetical protein
MKEPTIGLTLDEAGCVLAALCGKEAAILGDAGVEDASQLDDAELANYVRAISGLSEKIICWMDAAFNEKGGRQ